MENKKVIDYGRVWTCENMDNLAPIDWEGYKVLFSDGSTEIVDSLKGFERATEEEIKDFYQKRNFIFKNDKIVVIKGRKLPLGEQKTVERFFDYEIPNTYGKRIAKYVVFTDGTKTDIKNIKNIKATGEEQAKEFTTGYCLSGRI